MPPQQSCEEAPASLLCEVPRVPPWGWAFSRVVCVIPGLGWAAWPSLCMLVSPRCSAQDPPALPRAPCGALGLGPAPALWGIWLSFSHLQGAFRCRSCPVGLCGGSCSCGAGPYPPGILPQGSPCFSLPPGAPWCSPLISDLSSAVLAAGAVSSSVCFLMALWGWRGSGQAVKRERREKVRAAGVPQ